MKITLHIGVCLVRFRWFCMRMANRNRVFRFVKFSTETDWNGWKSIYFCSISISIGFQFSKERVIEIFKTLTLITFKKQSNWATERAIEQIRTTKKEQLPTIFVQQFTHRFQHKINNILNQQKGPNRQLYHWCTIAGATVCLIMLESATMSL